jgi:hypothetical protein
VPSEVIQVNEDESSESIDPPADIDDHQTETEPVVENPATENDLTDEVAEEGPVENNEIVEDEVTVFPPEEGKRRVPRLANG